MAYPGAYSLYQEITPYGITLVRGDPRQVTVEHLLIRHEDCHAMINKRGSKPKIRGKEQEGQRKDVPRQILVLTETGAINRDE